MTGSPKPTQGLPGTTKSKSWREGYDAGYAGLVASQMIFPDDIDWSDFNCGYAVGCRSRRTDQIIDEWEASRDAR